MGEAEHDPSRLCIYSISLQLQNYYNLDKWLRDLPTICYPTIFVSVLHVLSIFLSIINLF